MKIEDVKHLEWLYCRLVDVVQMDKNVDYLRRFKKIIDQEKIELEPKQSEPIIVKSGNTWVAEYQGVDYLCILPDTPMNLLKDMTPHKIKSFWRPIPEIEITDKIALLRPMVKVSHYNEDHDCLKLTFIDKKYVQCVGVTYTFSAGFTFELATVKDLQESS